MDTNYTALNNRVQTAITAHLLSVNTLTPNADVPVLSKEITEVVFGALKAGGFGSALIENLGKGKLAASRSRGN